MAGYLCIRRYVSVCRYAVHLFHKRSIDMDLIDLMRFLAYMYILCTRKVYIINQSYDNCSILLSNGKFSDL
jgi:hypothetical protein